MTSPGLGKTPNERLIARFKADQRCALALDPIRHARGFARKMQADRTRSIGGALLSPREPMSPELSRQVLNHKVPEILEDVERSRFTRAG